MRIEIPDFCLVLLIGASGSGKSHLARRLFAEDEILSSDYFRKLVCGSPENQEATEDAYDCLYQVANKRLNRRKLTVIDATNLNKWARNKALEMARDNNCFCVAIALNLPEKECQENNASREDRQSPKNVVSRQCSEMRQLVKSLNKEKFRYTYTLNSRSEAEGLEISRIPLWTDRSREHGPFDIIGDVHGCYQELCELLKKLGYNVLENEFLAIPPEGRKAVFLGDFCDRGPANLSVLRLVMNMHEKNYALCVPGNHDDKLLRYLEGKKVQVSHGLERTVAEFAHADEEFKNKVKAFLDGLVSHYMLDEGKLVVCHAGLPAHMQGRSSKVVRAFCLYGDPTGEFDEYGLPIRNDWAQEYNGKAFVAYGHCPEAEPIIINNTICLDAGCVFGGKLAALRYPEMDIVTVPAHEVYSQPVRPLKSRKQDSLPDTQKLLKRQRIETGLGVTVIREEERSLAALEIMGRFAVDPHWLIYLPPTMLPCECSSYPDFLEHPAEAIAYYKKRGIARLICEEKHMGSRALILVCKDAKAAQRRFLVDDELGGVILTRTGRPFFTASQRGIYKDILEQFRGALDNTGFWNEHATDWVCLDCEILPWSFKAASLVDSQYAPYGIAAANGLEEALASLAECDAKNLSMEENMELHKVRKELEERQYRIHKYNKVWQSYCRPVSASEDIRVAPFHILASEGKVWSDVSHDRQLQAIEKYLAGMTCFTPTRNIIVDTENSDSTARAINFWEDLTQQGAEGIVVKPLDFIAWQGRQLLQPAIKCRGREYLRIIYGAEYDKKLDKLKNRSLASKRRRALREFALGIEALERFVKGQPLPKVHECVFSILALESEPQDARL